MAIFALAEVLVLLLKQSLRANIQKLSPAFVIPDVHHMVTTSTHVPIVVIKFILVSGISNRSFAEPALQISGCCF